MNSLSIALVFLGTVLISLDGASVSDIKIYFNSKSNPVDGVVVDISNRIDVEQSGFSAMKDTFFFIHGWQDKYSSESCKIIKSSLLESFDINLFTVDWSKIADNVLYPIVFQNVESVGTILADLMKTLVMESNLDLGQTTIVGHSLGAHIGGVAGKHLGGEVQSVVGLDPAGPLFTSENTHNRLTKESGKFVQAIHTCGGLVGYFDQLGHSDYYPNGGRKQPMCELDITGKCSHHISLSYYAESVKTGKFRATKCDNYDDYSSGKCENNDVSHMGGYKLDTHASGTYYLKTNKEPPYATD